MTQTIINQATELLTEQFTNGEGLRGVPLKNYSGPQLEEWSESVLKFIIEDLQQKYPNTNIEYGKGYLKSDHEGFGDERLDQHIKVNGKYAYLQEDRAWVDKPFYTLKRAVIRNIILSCPSQLSPKVKFGLVGYCIDIKEDLVKTCNHTQSYGDLLERFSLTGRRRSKKVNGKTVNWYETGFVEETVVKYINYVYAALEEAILA
tara:strand:+ start:529 stop:1140 length:612 start_codon:yes stop_codon:yes gene_type:complete